VTISQECSIVEQTWRINAKLPLYCLNRALDNAASTRMSQARKRRGSCRSWIEGVAKRASGQRGGEKLSKFLHACPFW
jgi:hypothetical protein